MFFPGSRYLRTSTYQVTAPDGRQVTVARPAMAASSSVLGWHALSDGDRLDLIAYQYLADATAFWALCDANGTVVPASLAARPYIAVPPAQRTGP
ncbi:MAG TPA: hypothetical protein VFN61_11915 [Acidimicrobiales bacterium]|nr:hypothetical protein [Acidimicrobiales bacterium]